MFGPRWLGKAFSARVCAIARSLRGAQKKRFVHRLRFVAGSRARRFEGAKKWLLQVLSTQRNAVRSLVQTVFVGLTSSASCLDARTRSLRFEPLEGRALLTTTLLWNPTAVVPAAAAHEIGLGE